MTIECGYVTLKTGRQVHYRKSGSGPPMILMHPSPQCSEAILPALMAFSAHCTCYALDTPGYGLSDPMVQSEPEISDFADTIIDTVDALGMDRFFLYGAATGAQTSIEIGKKYPDRLALLMLDTNGHVSDEEREEITDGYFPDVTACRDGRHLMTYWDMCRHLFVSFPWQSGKQEYRLPIDLPPTELMQTLLLRYLRAGTHYDLAYRKALDTEHSDHMIGLDIPTTMMRWEGSIALSITDALIETGLPDNVTILHAGPAIEERYAVQTEMLAQEVAKFDDSTDLKPAGFAADVSSFDRTYLPAGEYQLHAQVNAQGDGHPVIFIHDALRSSAQMEELATPHIGKRPVILIDIPGHGASAPLSHDGELTMTALAVPIEEALKQLPHSSYDVVGSGLGGAIAIEIGKNLPVNDLQIIDPVVYSGEDKARYLEHGLPDLSPQLDGTHLVRAWAMIRDNAYYWPWFDHNKTAQRRNDADVRPEFLHQQTVDLLRTGSSYRDYMELTIGLNWARLLDDIQIDHEVIYTDTHPGKDQQPAS